MELGPSPPPSLCHYVEEAGLALDHPGPRAVHEGRQWQAHRPLLVALLEHLLLQRLHPPAGEGGGGVTGVTKAGMGTMSSPS